MPLKNPYADQHLFTASWCFVNRTKGWGQNKCKRKDLFPKKRAKHNRDIRTIFALKDITQRIKALGLTEFWHCYIVFVFFKSHMVNQNSLFFYSSKLSSQFSRLSNFYYFCDPQNSQDLTTAKCNLLKVSQARLKV